MPSYGKIFSILFALPLLCGLHGCMIWDSISDAEYEAARARRMEEYRILDSVAANRDGAFEYFRTAYGIGSGGGRGSISFPKGAAFRTLLAQPDATELFTRLIREGSRAGQIYGLAGLRMVDTVLFARELPAFLASTDSVESSMGCFAWKRPVSQVAKKPDEPPPPGTWQDPIGDDIYSGSFPRNVIEN